MQNKIDTVEQELLEKLENLRTIENWFSSPGWTLAREYVLEVERAMVEALMNAKTIEHAFHFQGQVSGIRILLNIPSQVTNDAMEVLAELKLRRENPEMDKKEGV